MMNLLKVSTTFIFLKICTICFLMFSNISVFSQNQPLKSNQKNPSIIISENELLETSKNFISKKKYKLAKEYIAKHYDALSKSYVVNWIYAHALSLNDDKKEAYKTFRKALMIEPNNKELQMDYARFLYGIGEIDEATFVMNSFMNESSNNIEFLLMQANISFWKRDLKNSRKKINSIKEIYPNTDITKNLEDEISNLTATYIHANFEYQTDSQPLEQIANNIVIGEYISRFFSPQIEISRYSFLPQKVGASIIKFNNQFYFDKLKLIAKVSAGAYYNDSDTSDWIGEINLTKNLFKNVKLKFGYSKDALLGTVASTILNLTQQDLFSALDYRNKYIELNAAYNYKFFNDNNNITSIGAWIVSQPIKIQKFGFQFGYGYNYTDSEEILFFYDNQGNGTYDLYFTPKGQEIHSALFISSYAPTQKITISAKLNYGMRATVQNPYPIEVTAGSFETGGFYKEDFNYTEINGAIGYAISNKVGLNLNYIYQETFFYTRDNFNLGLNFTF